MRRNIPCHTLMLYIAAVALQAPLRAASVPFQGAAAFVSVDTPKQDATPEPQARGLRPAIT